MIDTVPNPTTNLSSPEEEQKDKDGTTTLSYSPSLPTSNNEDIINVETINIESLNDNNNDNNNNDNNNNINDIVDDDNYIDDEIIIEDLQESTENTKDEKNEAISLWNTIPNYIQTQERVMKDVKTPDVTIYLFKLIFI